MKMDTNKEDAQLISDIGRRAVDEGIIKKNQRLDLEISLTVCHMNGCPLRLHKMLDADYINLQHDLLGIMNHIDRTTGRMPAAFQPRFALLENDPALLKLGTIVESVDGVDWDEGVMSNDDTDTIVRRQTKPGERGKIVQVEETYCGVEFLPSEVWVNPEKEELLDPKQYRLYPGEQEPATADKLTSHRQLLQEISDWLVNPDFSPETVQQIRESIEKELETTKRS